MNRDWVGWHLREAAEELSRTIEELGSNPTYDLPEFEVAMQHLYHHLNTAWNARSVSQVELEANSTDNFNRWSEFPADLPIFRA